MKFSNVLKKQLVTISVHSLFFKYLKLINSELNINHIQYLIQIYNIYINFYFENLNSISWISIHTKPKTRRRRGGFPVRNIKPRILRTFLVKNTWSKPTMYLMPNVFFDKSNKSYIKYVYNLDINYIYTNQLRLITLENNINSINYWKTKKIKNKLKKSEQLLTESYTKYNNLRSEHFLSKMNLIFFLNSKQLKISFLNLVHVLNLKLNILNVYQNFILLFLLMRKRTQRITFFSKKYLTFTSFNNLLINTRNI